MNDNQAGAEDGAKTRQVDFITLEQVIANPEVHAFMEHFWKLAVEKLGEEAGNNFIVVTDPGSMLIPIAEERNFRAVVISDPNVGGRFSAMTAFGIAPAALMGFDVEDLLVRAQKMAQQCKPSVPAGRNPGKRSLNRLLIIFLVRRSHRFHGFFITFLLLTF